MSFMAVSILCKQCFKKRKGDVDTLRLGIVDYLSEMEGRMCSRSNSDIIKTDTHKSYTQFIDSLELMCNDCFREGRKSARLDEAVQKGYMDPFRKAIDESKPPDPGKESDGKGKAATVHKLFEPRKNE